MRNGLRGSIACALFVGSLTGGSVAAQVPVPIGDFNVMRYTPAPGPRNYFQVEGASTPGHVQGSAGLALDYGHAPFVLYNSSCDRAGEDCTVEDTRSELVHYTAAAHVTGSLALFDRLQIGLVVPLVLTSGEPFEATTGGRATVNILGGDAFVLGDPRLSVKGRLFTDPSSGLSFGASAFVTIPTGHYMSERRFVGDPLPTFGGHAIVELVSSGFHMALNAGAIWRDETVIFSSQIGSQLTYGFALGYDVTPIVGIFGELTGASSFAGQIDEHYLEWRVGGRFRVDDFDINLAGGTGLTQGVGTPLFRVVAGFQWAPIHADTDGDGVEDALDNCPTESEDMDGWEDDDGCPEADNDGDGLLDADDPCPDEAEDMDGFEDDDGCPDNDNDGDGIHDGYDSCPDAAEDMDGDRDEDGCPDNDTDRDGIEDSVDQCVDQPEDFDGFGDEDGCPEEDFDLDGIPDTEDQCPDQAGAAETGGCPAEDAAAAAP